MLFQISWHAAISPWSIQRFQTLPWDWLAAAVEDVAGAAEEPALVSLLFIPQAASDARVTSPRVLMALIVPSSNFLLNVT